MLRGWSVHSSEIPRHWITYLVHTAGIELVESIEDVKWLGSCRLFFLDNNLFFDSSLCSQLVLFRAFCGFETQHADKKINVHAIFWSFSPFITANAQAHGKPIFCACHFIVFWHWIIGYITICISLPPVSSRHLRSPGLYISNAHGWHSSFHPLHTTLGFVKIILSGHTWRANVKGFYMFVLW